MGYLWLSWATRQALDSLGELCPQSQVIRFSWIPSALVFVSLSQALVFEHYSSYNIACPKGDFLGMPLSGVENIIIPLILRWSSDANVTSQGGYKHRLKGQVSWVGIWALPLTSSHRTLANDSVVFVVVFCALVSPFAMVVHGAPTLVRWWGTRWVDTCKVLSPVLGTQWTCNTNYPYWVYVQMRKLRLSGVKYHCQTRRANKQERSNSKPGVSDPLAFA